MRKGTAKRVLDIRQTIEWLAQEEERVRETVGIKSGDEGEEVGRTTPEQEQNKFGESWGHMRPLIGRWRANARDHLIGRTFYRPGSFTSHDFMI